MNPQLIQGYQVYPQAHEGEYNFIAADNVVYDAYFIDASEFFPGNSFASDATMFNLEPAGGGAPPSGLDPLIGPTVADILARHFAKNPNRVIAYICATDDAKERLRVRKFDAMFDKQNNINKLYKKINIHDTQRDIYGAVIYSINNPAEVEILKAAERLPRLV
jgi:hypothetical protein